MRAVRGDATRTRAVLALGAGALLVATGCTTGVRYEMAAVPRPQSRVDRLTDNAEVALAERRGTAAVRYAEQAVALAPTDARYRALLGHAYLHAGRFASAAEAAADALRLDPRERRAALDLALAQTALGDWTAARATLTTYAQILSPADRGLALALAGDPLGGAVLIGQEARGPTASATARQNLALALALAGHWQDAQAVAAVDLSPELVEQRMQQWRRFVQPVTSSQQVATLLGITPVRDPGQPAALALVMPALQAFAEAAEPVTPAAPVETASVMLTAGASAVKFAPRREIVQPIAPRALAAVATPRAVVAASGRYYVQLGAHQSATIARVAWDTAQRRHKALAALTPSAAKVQVGGSSLYRLSVGGFAQAQAATLCRQLQAEGGSCFVRTHAGDAVASWAGGGTQLAAR
ncbi:tetratricopeptide repeat protein [Sphingomonas sp. 3-13AW]|uniref:SPOR domain-containing protein n=1 Tax=Sphingomonas sp. 3-13AW TaxID=3050450 RepID=UPI003BB6B092